MVWLCDPIVESPWDHNIGQWNMDEASVCNVTPELNCASDDLNISNLSS